MDVLDLILIILISLHLLASPYTKVEESFNLHAIHDILLHGSDLNSYDHFEFPGVVPRTFVGAIVISLLSKPFQFIIPLKSKFSLQIISRGVLGCINAWSLIYLRACIRKAFGKMTAFWFGLFQLSQFHIIYYASRTLPNMFAFPLTSIALGLIITGRSRGAIYTLTFASIVFRSEVAIFTSFIALMLVFTRTLSFFRTVLTGLEGVIGSFAISALVDSYFWRFPVVPEAWGFFFNVIQGKSSEWGVHPFHLYFTSFLPKLLQNPATIILSVFSVYVDRRVLRILVPSLCFIGLYSLQPHKEWRFIVYVVPTFVLSAAIGAAWISNRFKKGYVYMLATLILLLSVTGSMLLSAVMLMISTLNYPGGEAIALINSLPDTVTNATIYLDPYTCMTGASLFLQYRDGFEYDRTEDKAEILESAPIYTHLLMADKYGSPIVPSNSRYWVYQRSIKGYAGIRMPSLNAQFWRQPEWWKELVNLDDKIYIFVRPGAT
ncbi:Alg9-like mannosyltransferase family-domain-containing protein [Dipodascopsis uninucleata]